MMRWMAVVMCVSGWPCGLVSEPFTSPRWDVRGIENYRLVLVPLDVRLGPLESTLVMARLERMDFLRVYDTSSDGAWMRVLAIGHDVGIVRGWVLIGDLLHRTRPVQGGVGK